MLHRKKIIVFGASEVGQTACEYLSHDNDVLFVCDNDKMKWGTLVGRYVVFSPEEILENKDAVIVVALVRKYKEVAFQLHSMGIYNIWHFVQFMNLVTGRIESKIRQLPYEILTQVDASQELIKNGKNKECLIREKNVLIFAYYFPPVGGSGVQRTLKFAKYLRQFDYNPIVISRGNCEIGISMDYSFLDELENIQVVRIQEKPHYPEEITNEDYLLLESLLTSVGMDKKWIYEYFSMLKAKWEFLPDNGVTWALDCIKAIEDVVDLKLVSIVYTTIGPYSSALIGAFLKLKHGLKWVLDYRDPWCLNNYNMKTFYGFRMDRREYEKKLEIRLLNNVDYVVSTAEAFCKDCSDACPTVKTKCITNGYDEEDFCFSLNNNDYKQTFNIIFNGYIYEYYELCPFLDLLNELIESGIIVADKLRLVFNGSNPAQVEGLMDKDKHRIIKYNGYLPHKESIKKLFGASILLLFGAYGEGAYFSYSGKVFEYLRTGIPILSVSSPYGVQYEMVEEHKRGITATMDNKDKIKSFITEKYEMWLNNHVEMVNEPDEYVRSFSRHNLTKRLSEVFDEVLKAN